MAISLNISSDCSLIAVPNKAMVSAVLKLNTGRKSSCSKYLSASKPHLFIRVYAVLIVAAS
ncbi:MAG TPA: hypothetical protein VFC79_11180, partial [Tissierellaceae bacterium]|nr:hypothetical protein [Tissierellaceae bacterium]